MLKFKAIPFAKQQPHAGSVFRHAAAALCIGGPLKKPAPPPSFRQQNTKGSGTDGTNGKIFKRAGALGLLALVILAAAQLGAQLLASLPLMVGAPVWLGNVLAGVLYAALGVAGLLLLCGKGPARDAGGMAVLHQCGCALSGRRARC